MVASLFEWFDIPLHDVGAMTEYVDKLFPSEIQLGPWFLSDGSRAIKGADENRRNLISAQRKYASSIIKGRLNVELRGAPIVSADGHNEQITPLLGGKHLAMAAS